MEASADFEERCHSAVNFDSPFRGLCDPAENLQERALSRAIAADNSNDFALFISKQTSFSAQKSSRGASAEVSVGGRSSEFS